MAVGTLEAKRTQKLMVRLFGGVYNAVSRIVSLNAL